MRTALLFIVGIMLLVGFLTGGIRYTLVIAAMIGGYRALNIGADTVANSVGPAHQPVFFTIRGMMP